MELAAAFRAEISAGGDGFESEGLETRLAALVSRGRAAHPNLALDEVRFARHLGRIVARAEAKGAPPLEQLAIEDLFLACACREAIAGAADRFEERCGARMRAVLAATVKSDDLRTEVRQRVLDILLVGTASTPPRIEAYGGLGPLDSWAAVVTQRQLATLLDKDTREKQAREGAGVEAAMAGALEPEVAFAKQHYRRAFEQAMSDALGVLDEEDRLLLRLQLVSQVSVENIAKMYGVAQSTASRRLAKARDVVQAEVTRLLQERLGAETGDLASLAGLVASQIDVSISRLLRPQDVGK